jgi:tRNA (mo5U34)-methyltransferase
MTSFNAETSRLQEEIESLGPWFHNLHLPDGTQTAPDHFLGDFPRQKWAQIVNYIPHDLSNWRVLDIGCNAGFYSFELARRGANVVGIDSEELYLTQARWAARQLDAEISSRIDFRQMQIYDLARWQGRFDLVLFMGVFYHLRYPQLALDIVAQLVDRLMVFQTLTMPGEEVHPDTGDRPIDDRDAFTDPGWPKMAFIEHSFAGDRTNWWAPNHAAVEALLRSAGMRVLARPGHEIYLCEPNPSNPSCVATWDADELRSATGRRGS